MGDWLGTGNVATYNRKYRAFKKARAFARRLGLNCRDEWNNFCRGGLPDKGVLPEDIPIKPNKVYAETGWAGVGDWLGTGSIATTKRKFRSFEAARVYVRQLGLNSWTEWDQFRKGSLPEKGLLPVDIPTNPNRTYANKGWSGMGDWLGTGRTRVSKSPKRKT